MVASGVGLLTVGLALWVQLAERRQWLRRLAWGTLALVVAYSCFLGVISAPINANLRAENERTAQLDREVARMQEARAQARGLPRATASPR